jgi:pimeloyl-ACP methyl ester carboxylesterase
VTVDRVTTVSRRGLVYSRVGSGPTALLVHGWCLNRTVWMYLEHALVEAGFEVIAPDLAGFGESAELGGIPTIDRHGEDVADLLDELDLHAVTVVGFAFGAAVLLRLPRFDRVGRIVSIGVPSAAGAPYGKMRAAMLRDWPLFASRSARAIVAREHSEASLDWLARAYGATPLRSALAGADELAAFEPSEVEQRWSVPSLFVHGADDTVVSPAVSAAAAERFDDAALTVIADCGHFVPWDQPGELADAVIGFARP